MNSIIQSPHIGFCKETGNIDRNDHELIQSTSMRHTSVCTEEQNISEEGHGGLGY